MAVLKPDSEIERTAFAWTDDALGTHDATALAEMIRSGERSARELVEAAIARAQSSNESLHGIVTDCFDRAREEAGRPLDGPFAGVPIFIKDNVDVTGVPTRFGTDAFVAGDARRTSPIARLMFDLGMICLGKTTLPEFGFNATYEPADHPATRNPWNLAHTSGGSSSGSAAMVAAGVVPLAHGNDGGGSIRIPAACCGLIGLKPSRGRLPNDPVNQRVPVQIVCEGVLTRSVRDTVRFYEAAQTRLPRTKLPPVEISTVPSSRRLRIGWLHHSRGEATDDDTRWAVDRTVARLSELGHEMVEVVIPVESQFADDFALYWTFLASMVHHLGRPVFGPTFDPTLLSEMTRGLSRDFRKGFYRLPPTIMRLKRSGRRFTESMQKQKIDLMLTPVTTMPATPVGFLGADLSYEELFERLRLFAGFTPLANAAGTPAISLPVGRTRRNIPLGVQLAADLGCESLLLDVALELEASGLTAMTEQPPIG